MGHLTRAEMEAVIRGGGSVMLNDAAGMGQIHTTIATLPSEVDLAIGDQEKEAVATDALDSQIAALMSQKRQLDNARERRAQATKSEERGKGDASDGSTNAQTEATGIPEAGIGGDITELPPSGDRIGGDVLRAEHEQASGEASPDAPAEEHAEAAEEQSAEDDEAGREASDAGGEPDAGPRKRGARK